MKFSYQFSNLLGCPYRNGNVSFTPDGDSLVSPAGNCLTVFDLKKNTSRTLPFQTSFNITRIALSPNGYLAMAANENNDLLSISLISRSLLRTYHLNSPIHDIQWSPDGKLVAVARGTQLIIYCAPTCVKDVNPFHIVRILRGAYDELSSISWASDSSAIVVGSRDGTTRVYKTTDDDDEDANEDTKETEATALESAADKEIKISNISWSRRNIATCSLGGASGPVVAAFFESQHLPTKKGTATTGDDGDDDESHLNVYVVTSNSQVFAWKKDPEIREFEKRNKVIRSLVYRRAGRFSYKSARRKDGDDEAAVPQDQGKDSGIYVNYGAQLKTATYHSPTRILCAGFSDGSLMIHEMPSFTLIHSLSVSEHALSSIRFNASGDWLAIASKELGQIAVWEWRSEMFVLKQQGHFHATSAVAISPDGRHLASGGNDAKIKLWDLTSGHSYVTFGEHSAGIVGLAWTQSGKAVISASLDGTVRAFDTTRYRNFRTFATPKSTQLTSVAVDDSGELVAAGAADAFEVFLWSLSTGQLLDTFTGHEAPISGVTFLPTPRAGMLVSSSWDSTLRFWAVTGGVPEHAQAEGGGTRDAVKLSSDVLAVAARPDGVYVAAISLDCQIAIIETETCRQISSIEAKHDVGSGRHAGELITAKHRAAAGGQHFSTLRYSPDGEYLLAAGLSRFLCIYSVAIPGEEILLRRMQISMNMSLDANQEFLSRRHMTEFGYLNTREMDNQDDDADNKIALPGTSKHDMAARKYKHSLRVWAIDFNPGGDNFVAASSEGLLLYSLNTDLTFDPMDLDIEMTVDHAESLIKEGDLARALIVGLKLKNKELLARVVELIKPAHIQVIVSRLPSNLVPDFIAFIASKIDGGEQASRHLELYLKWADAMLLLNASKFFAGSGNAPLDKIAPALTLLQRAVSNRFRVIGQLCDFVQYSIKYVASQQKDEDEQDLSADSESETMMMT